MTSDEIERLRAELDHSAFSAAQVPRTGQRLARGDAPETAAVAERHGVSRARLSVACGRAGLELPRGRPRKAPAGERKKPLDFNASLSDN